MDGVIMASPLGLILASIFLSHHEENWLNERPTEFKPTYRRFVDDIFFCYIWMIYFDIFESTESAHSFRGYIFLNIRT